MAQKFTEMERKALEAKRAGNHMRVEQRAMPDGPPVVTLQEFAQAHQEGPPPPGPGPLPPPMPEMPELPAAPAPAGPTPGLAGSSEVDIEKMKDALFGQATPAGEANPADSAEPAGPAPSEDLLKTNRCPRCGWNISIKELVVPTEEDKLEFIESILGGRRFIHRVELLGKRLKATYRSVLVQEEDAITEHLNDLMSKKTVQNEAEWQLAYHRARLVTMLQELVLQGQKKAYPGILEYAGSSPVERLRKALEEVPAGWPLALHGLLVQGMTTANDVYGVLMARAYDPNFWEGQAGGSA